MIDPSGFRYVLWPGGGVRVSIDRPGCADVAESLLAKEQGAREVEAAEYDAAEAAGERSGVWHGKTLR